MSLAIGPNIQKYNKSYAIYTDGSLKVGYGVYVTPEDDTNINCHLSGLQTVLRADIITLRKALQIEFTKTKPTFSFT